MRALSRWFAAASLVLGFGEAGLTPASAQGDPSADQIINSLKPGTGMGGYTRGIRPVGPAAPVPEVSAPGSASTHHGHRTARAAATPAEGGDQGAPSINLTVNFESGSSTLTPDAVHTLDHLGEALASATLAKYRFRIEGHTDTVGSEAANRALSAQRAHAVVDYIVKYFHVAPDRLQAVGMGEADLLVPTPPQTAEARNRRVQIVNLGT